MILEKLPKNTQFFSQQASVSLYWLQFISPNSDLKGRLPPTTFD